MQDKAKKLTITMMTDEEAPENVILKMYLLNEHGFAIDTLKLYGPIKKAQEENSEVEFEVIFNEDGARAVKGFAEGMERYLNKDSKEDGCSPA